MHSEREAKLAKKEKGRRWVNHDNETRKRIAAGSAECRLVGLVARNWDEPAREFIAPTELDELAPRLASSLSPLRLLQLHICYLRKRIGVGCPCSLQVYSTYTLALLYVWRRTAGRFVEKWRVPEYTFVVAVLRFLITPDSRYVLCRYAFPFYQP